MRITQVNYAYDDELTDPEALLNRYATLTGWSEAIAEAGGVVSVVQRFHRDAQIVRNGVEYIFRQDGNEGAPRSRLWPSRLHHAVRDLQPDVVHVNGLNVPLQTWLLRRVLPRSASLVVQDHGGGGPHSTGDRFWLAARRTAMRAVDAFFFTAAVQADDWRRVNLIASNQRVYQVLEASTTIRPMDRTVARHETQIEGDPALLWVGRLNANKSPLTILDGFERSLSRMPGAILTMIYGTDDLLPAVEQHLKASLLLASRVRLVGAVPRDHMAAFYSAADAFVLGSHHEGSGYALIEACACGLLPVVTDIPTFRVITDEGSIGALWPVDDAAAFAEAVVKGAARERSGSRERVLEHFNHALSWAAVARKAISAYDDVARRRRAAVGHSSA